MNYLDLNLTHLNSINPHELKRWNVIWRWSTWIITTIWATWTGLQLILKETSRPEWEERSFFFQLSLLKALYEYLPAYRDSLPQVFWLLRRNKGKVLWIMMERFDGINIKNFSPQDEEVANFQKALISIGIRKFDEGRINLSLFDVKGTIKIADLNALTSGWILQPNTWLESSLYSEAKRLQEGDWFGVYTHKINHTRCFRK